MPTRARRKADQKKHRVRVWAATGAVIMALAQYIFPGNSVTLVIVLLIVFCVSVPMARYGYVYAAKWYFWIPILVAHGIILSAIGWWRWPRIKVSPAKVAFAGFQGETFNFSVRNETNDDVYDVQIPFLLQTHNHLDSKFSAKVLPNGEPSPHIFGDYNYCYGKGNDIHKVLANEQEVLVVHVSHITSMGTRSFSVSYAGGEKLEAKAETPSFILTPYSFSEMQGTIGVRGDYRACKFVSANDGVVPQ
jgi:hypothetical protein